MRMIDSGLLKTNLPSAYIALTHPHSRPAQQGCRENSVNSSEVLSQAGWQLLPGLSSVCSGAWLRLTTHLKPAFFPPPLVSTEQSY